MHKHLHGMVSILWILAALFLGLARASAEVRLPGVFGDHMVLQREVALPVWGWADPGEEIIVRISGQSKKAAADAAGKWRVKLDPNLINKAGLPASPFRTDDWGP